MFLLQSYNCLNLKTLKVMTVRELIELLQKERETKKVYLSLSSALVELKPDNLVSQQWGITFR